MSNGQRKTVVVTHKCCYGFERIPGEMGCTKMVMKPLAETVADLGADEFLDLVEVRRLLITGRDCSRFGSDRFCGLKIGTGSKIWTAVHQYWNRGSKKLKNGQNLAILAQKFGPNVTETS